MKPTPAAFEKEVMIRNAMRIRQEQAKRVKGSKSLIEFSGQTMPGYLPTLHHDFMSKVLSRAMNREKGWTRLCVHMPPQHGKSLQISTHFPAWYLGNNPNHSVIVTAYNDEHAITFSRKIRNLIDSPAYQNIFPGIQLSKDSRAANRWELVAPNTGELIGAGINGRITGKGAELLLIDDPIKNRMQADSDTFREGLKEAYRSTLATRLHLDAIVICIMTRWHEDDLAGWLIKNHDFKYICLPAIAEENDLLHREVGEPLWPEKFPKKMIENLKQTSGEYNFYSLYQGQPRPAEGLLFKRSYFNIIDKPPNNLSWYRFWDLAVTEKKSADWTCSVRVAHDSNANVYVDSRIYLKAEWPKIRNLMIHTAAAEPDTVFSGIGNQGPQNGMVQQVMTDTALLNANMIGIPEVTSKRIRSYPVIARGEMGKLYLVKGLWNDSFIEECIEFDVGVHDDQVDALSGAFKLMAFCSPDVMDPVDGPPVITDGRMEEKVPTTYLDDLVDMPDRGGFDELVTPFFN